MEVKLPKLGEGAESGTVVSVLVKEGDSVEEGQTILELENEKAVVPIPSSARGVVQSVQVQVGDPLSVGQIILTLGDSSGEPVAARGAQPSIEMIAPAARTEPAKAEVASTASDPTLLGEEPFTNKEPVAPPSIRRLARQLGLDLTRVRGSGRGGRIAMADLRDHIQRLQRLSRAMPTAKPPAQKLSPPEGIDYSKWGPVTRQPLSPLRQTISRRMSENWDLIPHVTQFEEVDITDLNQLRKMHGQSYEEKGAKLTLTAFALKAVAATLKLHPQFNVSLEETGQALISKSYYHIGLAVDTEHGLLVPVIRDVDQKSLLTLAREINDVAAKARARSLSLEEMKGGTFTISNQGGIGGGSFTPIINRPDVAILGLGRGVLKPVVREGQIVARLLMPMGLSYDHRVIDGGVAARFVVDLAKAFQGFSGKDVELPPTA